MRQEGKRQAGGGEGGEVQGGGRKGNTVADIYPRPCVTGSAKSAMMNVLAGINPQCTPPLLRALRRFLSRSRSSLSSYSRASSRRRVVSSPPPRKNPPDVLVRRLSHPPVRFHCSCARVLLVHGVHDRENDSLSVSDYLQTPGTCTNA